MYKKFYLPITVSYSTWLTQEEGIIKTPHLEDLPVLKYQLIRNMETGMDGVQEVFVLRDGYITGYLIQDCVPFFLPSFICLSLWEKILTSFPFNSRTHVLSPVHLQGIAATPCVYDYHHHYYH